MSDDKSAETPEPEHEAPEPARADATGADAEVAAASNGGLPERPATSKLAIASAVLSTASVVLIFPLLAVLGAALGVVSINRIKATGAGGLRWAIAGIVIGLVWIATLMILTALGVGDDPKTT